MVKELGNAEPKSAATLRTVGVQLQTHAQAHIDTHQSTVSSKQIGSQQWRRSYLEQRVRVGGAGGEGTLLAVRVQGGGCRGGELR